MAPGTRRRPFEFKWPDAQPGDLPVTQAPPGAQQTPTVVAAPAPTSRKKTAAYNFSWDTAAAASSPSPIGDDASHGREQRPITEKRGRGRPKKIPLPPSPALNVAQASPVEISPNKPDSPEKRGRGRPKKVSQAPLEPRALGATSDNQGNGSSDTSDKGRRARPKKIPLTKDKAIAKTSDDGQAQTSSAPTAEKRPRGRPRKSPVATQPYLPHTAGPKIEGRTTEAAGRPVELTPPPAAEMSKTPSIPVDLPLSAPLPEATEGKAPPSGRPIDAASVFANFGVLSDGTKEEPLEALADDEELIAIEQKLRAMFNHEAPQSLIRPTHEKKPFLVPANARRENIEVTKRGTYGTQKRLVSVERVPATADTGARQEEMQKIAAHPLFPECVKLIVLDQRLKDADAQGALKLRWRMERLRRLLSEVDLRVRNTLDLVNERSRALA